MTRGEDNANNVRAGVYDGEWYWNADRTATAPTSARQAIPAGFEPLGYIAEGGPTVANLMSEGTSTPIRAWQNGEVVKIIRTPSDTMPTFTVPFIENNPNVIETAFGTKVTQLNGEGSYILSTNVNHDAGKAILDIIDGNSLKRYYIPNCRVTGVEVNGYPNNDAEGYTVTFTAEPSPELDGGWGIVFDTLLAAQDGTPATIQEPEAPASAQPAPVAAPEVPGQGAEAVPIVAYVTEQQADQAAAEMRQAGQQAARRPVVAQPVRRAR